MNLNAAAALARQLIIDHDLYGWHFEFSRRKRQFGLCTYGSKKIELSAVLTELNSEEQVRDVILHEIAHARVGPGYGHGPIWKQMAMRLGAIPIACIDAKNIENAAAPWVATCNGCSRNVGMYRKPSRKKACGECCKRFNRGKFSDKYELKFRAVRG
jgi:predicted SprT family Zn-dependent metalloprotease